MTRFKLGDIIQFMRTYGYIEGVGEHSYIIRCLSTDISDYYNVSSMDERHTLRTSILRECDE